jgi:hypothetical protein
MESRILGVLMATGIEKVKLSTARRRRSEMPDIGRACIIAFPRSMKPHKKEGGRLALKTMNSLSIAVCRVAS